MKVSIVALVPSRQPGKGALVPIGTGRLPVAHEIDEGADLGRDEAPVEVERREGNLGWPERAQHLFELA